MSSEDKNKSQALVKYEPKLPALIERLEKKKRELREALERGQVADPITAAFVGWGLSAAWASAATSAILIAASAGVSMLTAALTPRQRGAIEERGRRTGDLIIGSELGLLIPEIYAGDLSETQPIRSIWSLCTRRQAPDSK